jgi:hypothetical protein
MTKDPLAEFAFRESNNLFLSPKKGDSIKMRVFTINPMVSTDKFNNKRFAFVVWNYNEGRAQILNKGASIAKLVQRLHLDKDYGSDIRNIDVKLTATSTGSESKDVEYSIIPLPKAESLTPDIQSEVDKINLEEIIPTGQRLSEYMSGDGDEEPIEPAEDEPMNLDGIPF